MAESISNNMGYKVLDNTQRNAVQSDNLANMPVFSGEIQEGNVEQQKNEPPKLNFESFKRSDREHANELATRSLNEVKDAVRIFNSDFPTSPYVPDYTSFPRPEDFEAKNYGGKDAAYNAWKDAVKEWTEDCKQDMQTLRSTNLNDVNRNITKGFIDMYINFGLTREFIDAKIEECKGDINALKEALDGAVKELASDISREGSRTRSAVHSESEVTRDIVESESDFTRAVAVDEGTWTRNTVLYDGAKTRDVVREESAIIQDTVEFDGHRTRAQLKKEEYGEEMRREMSSTVYEYWNNHPKKLEKALNNILESKDMQIERKNFLANFTPGLFFENRTRSNPEAIKGLIENLSIRELKALCEELEKL